MVTKKDVMEVLKNIDDPELGIDIVSMGFVYNVEVNNNKVHIKMTLTTPGCPMHSMFVSEVENKVSKLEGVESVDVEMVFDPPWSPEKMSEEAKKKLGF